MQAMDNTNAESRRQIRSLFAILRAIVRRSSDGDISKSDYVAHLEGRISALARAHDMLMRSPEQGVDLEEIVHAELLAQVIPGQRHRVFGPETRIGREAAVPIALAIHELATNALIHGALGTAAGTLVVSWEHLVRDGRHWLRLTWQEDGAQLAGTPPIAKGFGLELLERTLPYELGATTRIEWSQPGARVELLVPAEAATMLWRPGDGGTAP
jgi:two-component sensor histidine kinase